MRKSHLLLKRLTGPLTEADETALEALYEQMRAGSAWKKTHRRRLAPLDDLIAAEVEARFAGGPISVHDMAASSAITSLELYRLLSASHQVTMRASDYYDAIHLVRVALWHVSFDVEGQSAQVEGPFRGLLKRLVVQHARAALNAGRAERLSLFHSSARAVAASDPNFQLAKEDFFSPLAHRYQVVRVMNALVEQNLSRDRIEAALRAIIPTVAERGLLVLGRNADEENGRIQATIFARGQDGFSVLRDMSDGYSMKAVVLALSHSYP
jgi:hypothetical protein